MASNWNHIDIELFQQLANDSQLALAQLIQRYRVPLLYYIRRLVGKDEWVKEVFLDTMLAVWQQRKEMVHKEDPIAWMIRIAHNKACNKLRDEQKPVTIPLDNLPFATTDPSNSESELEAKELERLVQKALDKLSPQERKVYLLSRKEGLPNKEIARQCQVSEQTVRNQLSSALRKIRKILRETFTRIII